MEKESKVDVRDVIIKYLQKRWNINKAKGNLAQVRFTEIVYEKESRKKHYHQGCWLLAPQKGDYYRKRVAVFVHDRIEPKDTQLKDIINSQMGTVASYFKNAGIQTIYAIPTYSYAQEGFLKKLESIRNSKNINDKLQKIFEENLSWELYVFDQESDHSWTKVIPKVFFQCWPTGGRPSKSRQEWDKDITHQYQELSQYTLLKLALHEAFYSGLIKTQLKLKIHDPYDVDGFVIAKDTNVIPLEMKEKTPACDNSLKQKYFGIDAGRILMLLLLVIPNNGNALYIVREMKENKNANKREFVKWKYTTLSDIILSSSWNLQGGGRGMTGGKTQTVKIPYPIFKDLDFDLVFSDNFSIGSMPGELKHELEKMLNDPQDT